MSPPLVWVPTPPVPSENFIPLGQPETNGLEQNGPSGQPGTDGLHGSSGQPGMDGQPGQYGQGETSNSTIGPQMYAVYTLPPEPIKLRVPWKSVVAACVISFLFLNMWAAIPLTMMIIYSRRAERYQRRGLIEEGNDAVLKCRSWMMCMWFLVCIGTMINSAVLITLCVLATNGADEGIHAA